MKAMKVGRSALVFVALAAMVPLAILAACGSDNFSNADPDADIIGEGDGGSPDSTIPSDADANADVDAAPPPPTWCQINEPKAFFCADFDEGDITKAYVQGVLESILTVQQDGGLPGDIVALADSGNASPSSLLTFTPVPASNGEGEQLAVVRAALADAPMALSFQLEFDLRLDVVGELQSIGGVFYLDDLTEGTNGFYSLLMGGGTTFVIDVTHSTALGPRPIVGVWTHFTFVIFPGGGTVVSQGSTTIDGGFSDVGSTATKPTLQIGQDTLPILPTGGAQISYDNVVLRATFPDAGDGG